MDPFWTSHGEKIKTRQITFEKGESVSQFKDFNSGTVYQTTRQPWAIIGSQTTASQPTQFGFYRKVLREWNISKDLRRKILSLDLGGHFMTTTNRYDNNLDNTGYYRPLLGGLGSDYMGPIFPTGGNGANVNTYWPTVNPQDLAILVAAGTHAIAKTVPNSPVASLATFIGELREGLPSMVGKGIIQQARKAGVKGALKGSGDEWLNLQFGIKPFLSDISKMVEASTLVDERVKVFLDGAGKPVFRRYDFHPVESVEVIRSDVTSGYPGMQSNIYYGPGGSPGNSQGKRTVTRRRILRMWFEGVYEYNVPLQSKDMFAKLKSHIDLADKLAGVEITPAVLWELLPWSWASDWWLDTGDVMSNLSSFSKDGLVMNRGYLMAHEVIEDTWALEGLVAGGRSLGPLYQIFTSEVKTRIKATPYGFGINPGTLSPGQLSIIGALGLSRSFK